MAVREGFEPSNSLTHYTLSRRAPSATRTPHPLSIAERQYNQLIKYIRCDLSVDTRKQGLLGFVCEARTLSKLDKTSK